MNHFPPRTEFTEEDKTFWKQAIHDLGLTGNQNAFRKGTQEHSRVKIKFKQLKAGRPAWFIELPSAIRSPAVAPPLPRPAPVFMSARGFSWPSATGSARAEAGGGKKTRIIVVGLDLENITEAILVVRTAE